MAFAFNPITGNLDLVGTSSGGGGISGAGLANQLSYFTAGTVITGNANFTIDTTNGILKLGSGTDIAEFTTLSSNVVAAGAFTDSLMFTYPVARRFAVIDYSIERGANYRVGTLLVSNDGTTINVVDNYQEIGSTNINLSSPGVAHSVSGANLEIRATSTSGVAGTLKKTMRRWS